MGYLGEGKLSNEFWKAATLLAASLLLKAHGRVNDRTNQICDQIIAENYPKVAEEIYRIEMSNSIRHRLNHKTRARQVEIIKEEIKE